MSHGQDDVLLLALANNELDKFLIGEPFYFQEAITDNDEPQNVIAAFDLLIASLARDIRHQVRGSLRCCIAVHTQRLS